MLPSKDRIVPLPLGFDVLLCLVSLLFPFSLPHLLLGLKDLEYKNLSWGFGWLWPCSRVSWWLIKRKLTPLAKVSTLLSPLRTKLENPIGKIYFIFCDIKFIRDVCEWWIDIKMYYCLVIVFGFFGGLICIDNLLLRGLLGR